MNNILSDITVWAKYSRFLPSENRRETWDEICDRVESMHLRKFEGNTRITDNIKGVFTDFVRTKKLLPALRTAQFGGTPIELSPARSFNCSFIAMDSHIAFSETMFLLLSGCGVGFSVQRHHIKKLGKVKKPTKFRRYLIGDSIEGWAEAIRVLVESYLKGTSGAVFDFRDIREKGAPLITSGGKAPGPEPLRNCLVKLDNTLRSAEGRKLTSLEVHDMMCIIADAVLSGGIRRSSLISLFDANDTSMMTCKSGEWWAEHPHRGRANNSAVLPRQTTTKGDFLNLWKAVQNSGSGEPGFYFTNDVNLGTNPCCEVSLRNHSFCNLVEINMSEIKESSDFFEVCAAASVLATIQASYTDFIYLRPEWKKVSDEDALIGVGLTGIAGCDLADPVLELGAYIIGKTNEEIAELIGINSAARTTVVKPAGTSSLVLGTSSGIHAWHSKYYLRSLRLGKIEAIAQYLMKECPQLVEQDVMNESQVVVRIPQKAPEGAILRENETALSLLDRVLKYQTHWIRPGHDRGMNFNNVSVTVSVKNHEWDEVGHWRWDHRYDYSGISVLPFSDHTYKQAPFETITEAQYNALVPFLKNIDLTQVKEITDNTELVQELSCVGGVCELI